MMIDPNEFYPRSTKGMREPGPEYFQMLSDFRAEVPCPKAVAGYLCYEATAALLQARRTQYGFTLPASTDKVLERSLRSSGIVGIDGPHLSAFGCAVRRALLKAGA